MDELMSDGYRAGYRDGYKAGYLDADNGIDWDDETEPPDPTSPTNRGS